MSVKFTKKASNTDEAEIGEVATLLGYRLPDEYLGLLSELNGAVPAANTFDIVGSSEQSGINEFLRVADIPRATVISGMSQLGNIFPIAVAEGGDRICLSADLEDNGFVYFWDHERVESRRDLVLLSKSLREFLGSLMPFDRSAIKVLPGQVKKAWINLDLLKGDK